MPRPCSPPSRKPALEGTRPSASDFNVRSVGYDLHGERSMRPPEAILQDASRAYERGRWLKGLRTAALVLPLMLVSFGCCGRPSASVLLAALLAVLVMLLVW